MIEQLERQIESLLALVDELTARDVAQKVTIQTITGDTTLDTPHQVVICNKASALAVTLPPVATSAGWEYWIKNKNTGAVTVDGNASETIDGATTYPVTNQYDGIHIICDGAEWWVIGIIP